MEFADLHYLRAPTDAGNSSRAAHSLGQNASTLSHRIARLENKLGLPLFERSYHGLRLTCPNLRLPTCLRVKSLGAPRAFLRRGSYIVCARILFSSYLIGGSWRRRPSLQRDSSRLVLQQEAAAVLTITVVNGDGSRSEHLYDSSSCSRLRNRKDRKIAANASSIRWPFPNRSCFNSALALLADAAAPGLLYSRDRSPTR
jgi:Bacterial regulatory helix-turn-helix protein, lysR family